MRMKTFKKGGLCARNAGFGQWVRFYVHVLHGGSAIQIESVATDDSDNHLVLHTRPDGKVIGRPLKGGGGDPSKFKLIKSDLGFAVIQSAASKQYLGFTEDGDLKMTANPEDEFRIEVTPPKTQARSWDFFKESTLTDEQKNHFYEHGYVVLKNEVSREICEATRKHINMQLAKGGLSVGVDSPPFRRVDPPVMNLITHTSVFAKVSTLFPKGKLPPPELGQIALRFPTVGKKVRLPRHVWHCDRMGNPNSFGNFSLLVGVQLSDATEPYNGQFTVMPGSHKDIGVEARENAVEWCKKQQNRNEKMKFDGEMLSVNVGDVIIVHPFLGHRAGPNHGPNIRYACYFRFTAKNHGLKKMRRNMWFNTEFYDQWEKEVEERIGQKRIRIHDSKKSEDAKRQKIDPA